MSEQDEQLPPLIRELLEPEPEPELPKAADVPKTDVPDVPETADALEADEELFKDLLGITTHEELVAVGFDAQELDELEQDDPQTQEVSAETVMALVQAAHEDFDPLTALQEIC